MRNLKTLGLAIVAALALSGLVASSAQAEFTLGTGGTHVTATQIGQPVITITVGETKCKSADATATASGTVTDLTFENPTFSECESLGRPADITAVGNCKLTLTTTGESHLCPTGGFIKITVTKEPGMSLCTIKVLPGTLNGIAFDNSVVGVNPMDIKVTVAANNVTYITEGSTKCGEINKELTCGTLNGEFTLQATNASNGAVDLTKN
jgi:hypothetical protein